MRLNKYCLISSILLLFFSCYTKQTDNYSVQCIKIDINNKIVFESRDNIKIFYTTYKEKKHGIYYKYDSSNLLREKCIYYLDTLLQMKDYYWTNNKLDSITFSTFNYYNETAIKNVTCTYPSDSIFFNLKYKIFDNEDEHNYKIELIGSGGIGVMSLSDSIYSPEYVNSHWDKMHKVKRYFIYKCGQRDNKNHYAQTYFLLLNRGEYVTVSRQIIIYHVPLIVDRKYSNKLKNHEIIF